MFRVNYRLQLTKISAQIIRLYPLIFILFVLFSINRIIFYFLFSGSALENNGFIDILNGFILGIRYDSATIMYGLSIPILLLYAGLLIPFNRYLSCCCVFSKIWMTIILCLFLFIFLIDVYFYEFYQDHLNIIFFDMFQDDTQAVLQTIWKNYPLLPIFIGLIIFGCFIYYLLGKIFIFQQKISFSPLKNLGILVGSFILFSIMARASFGLFPINMMDAAYTNNEFLNKLAPNPVFTFEKAVEFRKKQMNSLFFYQKNTNETALQNSIQNVNHNFVRSVNSPQQTGPFASLWKKSKGNLNDQGNFPHVIIVIMEGFGSWILPYETPEFPISGGLKKWMDKSVYFDRFIQTGGGSISNLQATLLSIPSIPYAIPISQQKYRQIVFNSAIGFQYKKKGYETVFVYGGKLSWQRIDNFLPNLGFDHIIGEGHFPPSTPKTDWGVFDQYLFDFVFDRLKNTDTPQFIVLFTTTNHPPFELPEDYELQPLSVPNELRYKIRGNEELATKRFTAYQYSCQKLSNFLNDLKNDELLGQSVIAVTADHNLQGIRSYDEKDIIDRYRVPFFLLGDKDILGYPRLISHFGGHVDIAPTLIELTLPEVEYLSFGNNLLIDYGDEMITVNQDGIVFTNDFVLSYDFIIDKNRFLLSIDGNEGFNNIIDQNSSTALKQIMSSYYQSASYFLEEEWNKYSNPLIQKVSSD